MSGGTGYIKDYLSISAIAALTGVTKDPTGFEDRTTSLITWDLASKELRIEPTGASFYYYFEGTKHIVAAQQGEAINIAQSGIWVAYFEDATFKVVNQTLAPINIYQMALVSFIYWNASLGVALPLQDERHGLSMPWGVHAYLHVNVGAVYPVDGSGGLTIVADTATLGANDSDAKIQFSDGAIWDEDIEISIEHDDAPSATDLHKQQLKLEEAVSGYDVPTKEVTLAAAHSFANGQVVTFYTAGGVFRGADTVNGATTASLTLTLTTGIGALVPTDVLYSYAVIPVWYRDGAAGDWVVKTMTTANEQFPFMVGATPRPVYNNPAGPWTQPEVGSTNFVAYWIFATSAVEYPIVAIMGQREDTTKNNATANNTPDGLSLGTLPVVEMKLLYRVIIETKNGYANSVNARIVDVDDYRLISALPSSGFTTPIHSGLSGLSYELAGHTGFGRVPYETNVNPTVNNDITDTAVLGREFRVGDYWFNTTLDALYKCRDSTATAADWERDSRVPYQTASAPGANNDAVDTAVLGRAFVVGDTWFDTAADNFWMCWDDSTGAAVWRLKEQAIYRAASNPTANNDDVDTAAIGMTFTEGDLWQHTTTLSIFQCFDSTSTAAVWEKVRRLPYQAASSPGVNNDGVDTATLGRTFNVGEEWFNTATLDFWICYDDTTGAAVWRTKDQSIYRTAADPTVNNDDVDTAVAGITFTEGDLWQNTGTLVVFMCIDSTSTAAVWNEIARAELHFGSLATGAVANNFGLETPDATDTLALVSKRTNGSGNISNRHTADVNVPSIHPDHIIMQVDHRDDSDVHHQDLTLKENSLELGAGGTGAMLLGDEADGASAVGTQTGSSVDLTTTGALVHEFLNALLGVANIDKDGGFSLCISASGSKLFIGTVDEEVTVAAAATTVPALAIPTNSHVIGIAWYVSTLIPTAATMNIGTSGNATRYATGITVTAGTRGFIMLGEDFPTGDTLLLTPNASPATATGVIHLVTFYYQITAPLS